MEVSYALLVFTGSTFIIFEEQNNLIVMQGNKGPNLIVDLSFRFSLLIITYTEKLELIRKYIVANQLLKSGTSIGANVWEAHNAESKQDFIHKMKLAAKEADETRYWLELCQATENYPSCNELLNDLDAIIRVLSKIIGSSKSGRLEQKVDSHT
jgi:four helix bundle protein